MKAIVKRTDTRAAFTIIELLTVMSIIVILISLLVPALSRVRRFAQRVKQGAQFHSIGVAMDLFNAEFGEYPNSDEVDMATPTPQSYCGAMKLAEAMAGQDLLGFHPDSLFRNDLTIDGTPATLLYDIIPPDPLNLLAREGPYLELENANAYRLNNIYGPAAMTGPPNIDGERYVLCDVYKNVRLQPAFEGDLISGKTGMPILYYRAKISGTLTHPTEYNPVTIDDLTNIYDYKDNDELVHLRMPFEPGPPPPEHLMDSARGDTRHIASGTPITSDAMNFYDNIYNENITTADRPYRSESYILLSAGFDGEYGTDDDVLNFEKR